MIGFLSLASGSRLGPYEILSPLGAGGMGEVFQALDTRLGRDVAIKVLPPGVANDDRFLARFEREAKAIGQLNHPHICTLYDIGHDSGRSYLVMELLKGESLADRLLRGPLPLRDVLRYGIEMAQALERAHRAGLVHRDLKPGNVMITRDGAKLLDFGLARQAPSALSVSGTAVTEQHPVTARGTIVGTIPYMSPEQLRGDEVDARTDIYSLGVMLHEMLTGIRPFVAANSASLIALILDRTAPRLSDLQPTTPRALEYLVSTCMEKDVHARFQCAADVAHELRWIAMERADEARPPAQSRRGRWGLALGAALLLAAAAALGYRLGGRMPSAPLHAQFTQLTFDAGEETHPSISPDGKFVVFVKNVNAQKDIFLQRLDGGAAINLTPDSLVDDDQPAFSPDGGSIAFRSARDGGGIFVMGATGESVRRVTTIGFDPAWSPDGTQLVFSGAATVDPRSVDPFRKLFIAEVATGATRVLYDEVDVLQPKWSPHGYRIAYWHAARGQRDIYTIDKDGRPSSVVAVTFDTPSDWNPLWSPDGQWLYFMSDRDGTMRLWRVAIDEKSGKTNGPFERMPIPSMNAGFASVARNGERFVYQSTTTYGELLRLRLDTSGRMVSDPRPILSGSLMARFPKLSPDGQWIAFAGARPQEHVFVMKPDGSGLRQLTNDVARDRGIDWWPDSSRIVFYSNRSGEYDAWTIRPDGSGLTRLTAIDGGVAFPRVSPDQRHIVYLSDSERGLSWQIWPADSRSRVRCHCRPKWVRASFPMVGRRVASASWASRTALPAFMCSTLMRTSSRWSFRKLAAAAPSSTKTKFCS